jgi:hypothetical protein
MTRVVLVIGALLAGCSADPGKPPTDGSADAASIAPDAAAPDAALPDASATMPPRDAGPEAAPVPDMAPACSPTPDQNGFYSSCAACPSPDDCDAIVINGNRRYACGCGGGCPCGLRCGSYRIPGTAITIGSICVR